MFQSITLLSLAVSSVYGHAFINSIDGANGVSGIGLGVTFNGEVPRGGTTEQLFQVDTPVLKDQATNPCGATLLAGSIDIATSMATVSTAFGGLPSVPANGQLTMGVFQVNADGGGPFVAEVNTDATGATWTALNVVSQPPGVNGILHNGPANSSITVEVPATTKCTGGSNGNACLIRLNNGGPGTGSLANGAGPFGGCAAFTTDASGGSAGTGTGAANSTATAAGSAASTGSTATGTGAKGAGKKGAGAAAAGAAAAGAKGAGAAAGGKGAAGGAAAAAAGGKNRKIQNRAGLRIHARDFVGLEARRDAIVAELLAKRDAIEREVIGSLVEKRQSIEREIQAKRDLLSAQLLDELSTATGTAIDIAVDSFAGVSDEALLGGNSTTADPSAPLSPQNAVDLKKAVQLAITQAMTLLSSSEVDAGKFGQDSAITDATNAAAAKAVADGTIKSVNAGNAGVGFFQTAVVESALGSIATATADLKAAGGAGAGSAATVTAAPAATATAATGTGKKGKGAGAAAGKGAAAAGPGAGRGGRGKSGAQRRRLAWEDADA
ncbi:hypothetical protein OF83DRAFT_1085071 [Amylostereum chailletii]|nr:hypothetical protein OF83DRAFT_1085071 [Amylostereum chailletii]